MPIRIQWYARLGVLSNANEKYFHGKIPTWNDFVSHPNYDAFWQKQAFQSSIVQATTVPNLNVAGWWDQEDFYGPAKVYELHEKHDKKNLNYFVAGPWNHGGWRRPDGSKLGDIPFDSNTSKYFREQIEAPWFAYWLKGEGSGKFDEATVFQTGSNRWEHYDSWPPKAAKPTSLYLPRQRCCWLSRRPMKPRVPIATSPTQCIRCLTESGPSAQPIRAAAGRRG